LPLSRFFIYLFIYCFILKLVERIIYLGLAFDCYSFADLQKPQVELDGKACAAVGQSSLMALYDTLFSQVIVVIDVQLLITELASSIL
jgi:hypothetical protein